MSIESFGRSIKSKLAMKKTDLVIVNKGFWPKSEVLGEGLLQFAEETAKQHSVCVITQADDGLSDLLSKHGRGQGVNIRACRAFTSLKSSVAMRLIESIYFMLWSLISLIRAKPSNVYVSTNPPVFLPFTVALYCYLFKSSYVYHIQDIHPEATNIVLPLNKFVFSALKMIDNYTINHAKVIITISDEMKTYIQRRSRTKRPIYLVDNPSFNMPSHSIEKRNKDIVFCGTIGRLQLIPLLANAIEVYIQKGGHQNFTFAGGGVFLPKIKELADKYSQVNYLGFISTTEAAELLQQTRFALLPIDAEVTNYAFPSKSSSYALSGAVILAICGINSSVARWIEKYRLGIICEPKCSELVECFFSLEKKKIDNFILDSSLRERLDITFFAKKLKYLSLSDYSVINERFNKS